MKVVVCTENVLPCCDNSFGNESTISFSKETFKGTAKPKLLNSKVLLYNHSNSFREVFFTFHCILYDKLAGMI